MMAEGEDASGGMPIDKAVHRLPTVSVVIPTGGGRSPIIDRTVSAVLGDPATTELIVVFDRPDAATESVVARYAARDTRVSSVRTIRYGSAAELERIDDRGQIARDYGARLATSEIVLALDDDVEPEVGLVSGHARRHAEANGRVVLGYMPPVLPAVHRESSLGTVRLYAENYERACARFKEDPDAVLLGLWGGNFSMSRKNWLAAAALPRCAAGYHVDRDFGMRLRVAGLAGVFDPGLRARHWYRRSPWRLAADARSAGLGRAALYTAYPELRKFDEAPAPRPAVRPIMWAARWGVAWTTMRLALTGIAVAASAARWWRAEDAAVRALARVGTARGVYQGGDHAT